MNPVLQATRRLLSVSIYYRSDYDVTHFFLTASRVTSLGDPTSAIKGSDSGDAIAGYGSVRLPILLKLAALGFLCNNLL